MWLGHVVYLIPVVPDSGVAAQVSGTASPRLRKETQSLGVRLPPLCGMVSTSLLRRSACKDARSHSMVCMYWWSARCEVSRLGGYLVVTWCTNLSDPQDGMVICISYHTSGVPL